MMNSFISSLEFEEWLSSFIDYNRNKNKNIENLNKMKYFANVFGEPQKNYQSIHIAGSKGKGSVSTMTASILNEAGLKTGLYTSPHVMDFRERISLAGSFFSDSEYSNTYTKIITGFKKIILENPNIDPGWFEIVTMTAFLMFSLEKTDWAVFETGLGGKLDMTNIIIPKACILTPIELEHCAYLGNTVEKIAQEKAGIIKENTPIFCSSQKKEVLEIFKNTANKKNCNFFYIKEIVQPNIKSEVNSKELKFTANFNQNNKIGCLFKRPLTITLQLLDSVQIENSLLAACAIKYLFPNINETIIEKGLSKAWLPARFEVLSAHPKIIIDGAHTKNSLEICLRTFQKFTKNHKNIKENRILLFACAKDKDSSKFIHLFNDIFQKIIITIPTADKESNIEELYNNFHSYFYNTSTQILKEPDYNKAIFDAINESKQENRPLLITGSFYLVAKAKKIWESITKQQFPSS